MRLARAVGWVPAPLTGAITRVASSARLKLILAAFILVLVLALSGLIFALVSRIFGELQPRLAADLEWKARRGASELARSLDLGMAVGDRQMIRRGLRDFLATPDVLSVLVTNAQGKHLASEGTRPDSAVDVMAGPEGQVRRGPGYIASWAESRIEGQPIGRVTVLISTARLEAGDRLRQQILSSAAVACVAALACSLFFVSVFLGPLITLTQKSVRVRQEMDIARRIQTSILPRMPELGGYEISAVMLPATEVGGDYYDVIPLEDGGCWIAIGDVAGHGVQAGLIMLMLQSCVAALVRERPHASPREVVLTANGVLFDNIRQRMGTDEHVTLYLIRLGPDGKFAVAGAHEEIIVCRAAGGPCELVSATGAWLGASRGIDRVTQETTGVLAPGDVMLLYTDGVTEARNGARELFGTRRLCEVVERNRHEPTETMRTQITRALATWSSTLEDDYTVLAIRRRGVGAKGEG